MNSSSLSLALHVLEANPSFHDHHRSTINVIPSLWAHRRRRSVRKSRRPQRMATQAVPTRPSYKYQSIRSSTDTITVYNDSWFDLIAIDYLSKNIQASTGIKTEKGGYDGLVEAASFVSQMFSTKKQQELVVETLEKAIPWPILSMIRALLPTSKFKRELFAIFTTFFFAWLIGPSEVKEYEMEGRMEKNVVHIKKCRFLEKSRCVGMCVNMCKMPSQKFIHSSFGVPVNMVPNFDDMSCEMIFGQEPPLAADDPALKQPCYKILCKAKKKHS
ncbi:hypothetical protein Syun_007701 [Stephania yunnanensis]|uniref:Beta-carotene isomerase D27-like C-terminal domain-containing protein n=1 Tax=Stephania yunnanensis TaxID=152371 RepID=A0AAP0L007_9MAGN